MSLSLCEERESSKAYLIIGKVMQTEISSNREKERERERGIIRS